MGKLSVLLEPFDNRARVEKTPAVRFACHVYNIHIITTFVSYVISTELVIYSSLPIKEEDLFFRVTSQTQYKYKEPTLAA